MDVFDVSVAAVFLKKKNTRVTFQSPCCDLIVSSFVGGQCAAFETARQSAQLKVIVWQDLIEGLTTGAPTYNHF